jgi:Zn-dependent protease with chaperone function
VRPDGTALCSLALVLLFLPAAGACLLPLALLGRRALGAPLWLSYGLWLASAFCYGLRPVQLAMARLLWPVRRPTEAESERLERIWRRVIAHAGVHGRRFRIRVVDLPDVNAHSVGRDLVCVTTGALGALGDRELAGVLAHELGHHLRMHTAVAAFLVWVLLPLQGIALLGTLLAAPAAALARRLADSRSGHPWASGCARGVSRLGHGIRAVFAAPGVAAFYAKNAAGRSAEYRVDAFAVDVGLGPELLSALRWFSASESAADAARRPRADRRSRTGRARHAAVRIPRPTHPPLDRRMARIAARVEFGPRTEPGAPAEPGESAQSAPMLTGCG